MWEILPLLFFQRVTTNNVTDRETASCIVEDGTNKSIAQFNLEIAEENNKVSGC